MIRNATLHDVDGIIALFCKHHEAMGCDWPVKTKVLRETLVAAITHPGNWLCLYGDECLLLAACFESIVGAGMLAQEIAFCASKGNRELLLDKYEEWARKKGCRTSSLSCIERPDIFARLYRKHGYSVAETTFCKVL